MVRTRFDVPWFLLVLLCAGCDDDTPPFLDGGSDADLGDGDLGADADAEIDADDETEEAGPPCGLRAYRLDRSEPSPWPDGIGGEGDLAVETDLLRAVFSAVDRPVDIAPSGGTLMDLHLIGRSDHMNELSQMAGAAQGMVVAYTEMEVVTTEPRRLVVESRGHVQPQPVGEDPVVTPDPGSNLEFVTRYEFRCGEPRLWLDSVLTNRGSVNYETDNAFAVMDLMLWGGNSLRPFCPYPGGGDPCPTFDIENPVLGLVDTPYLGSTGSVEGDPGTFAFYVDDEEARFLRGVHSDDVSSLGSFSFGANELEPGETRRLERVIVVGDGADAASAVDLALEALERNPLIQLDIGTVMGTVAPPVGETLAADQYARPVVVLATPRDGGDPVDPGTWSPVNMVRVAEDGSFTVRAPAGSISWEIRSRGRSVERGAGGVLEPGSSLDLGTITTQDPLPALNVHVQQVGSEAPIDLPSRVIVIGVDDTDDPWLGPDSGGSPTQNVALTDGFGRVTLAVAPGTYDVYATHGMGFSIARSRVEVGAEDQLVELDLVALDVIPDGIITADFHVHSGASMDSSLPTTDRLMSFLVEGVDAIVSTEHDVIFDYGPGLAALEETLPAEWQSRLRTFVGVEATPSNPFIEFPHTIGHHNAFPLTAQVGIHSGGAIVDEFLDLAELYERLRAIPSPVEVPLVQLNHGRSSRHGTIWLGYLDGCGFDAARPFDPASTCFAATSAMGTRPWDFDLMEIINGKDAAQFVQLSRDWHGLLRFAPGGRLPIASANSDSHRLVRDQAGYPVTFVNTVTPLAELDDVALVEAVRSGAVGGGLGAFLWAEARESGGVDVVGPGMASNILSAPSGQIFVDIRVAAPPWVPVDEVRVRLNGHVVSRLEHDALLHPLDPFGVDGVVRFEGTVDLSDEPLTEDAFLTVEAGFALSIVADLDGDGVIDATDNNGDGVVDEADLDGGIDVGPTTQELEIIAPGARSIAYINPIYIDVDGDSAFTAPGTPFED